MFVAEGRRQRSVLLLTHYNFIHNYNNLLLYYLLTLDEIGTVEKADEQWRMNCKQQRWSLT